MPQVPSQPLPVAILAGGRATRLGAIAERTPKLLVEVAGEPFFLHQIRLLKAAGIERVVVCAGHLGEMIVERFGDGSRLGVRIDHSFDGPRLLGTGGAIARALPQLGRAFYVLYGDSYLPFDYRAAGLRLIESGKLGLMTVFENRGRYDASNVLYENGRITAYDKKARLPSMRHIDSGLGAFRAAAFAGMSPDEPCDLADIQKALLARGELEGFEVRDRFYEIGSPEGLAELDSLLRTKLSTASAAAPKDPTTKSGAE